jgi:chorismate dehydratase
VESVREGQATSDRKVGGGPEPDSSELIQDLTLLTRQNSARTFKEVNKTTGSMKLKVSFIEYLNSVPLGWGFLHGPYQEAFDVIFDRPSQCAKHLSAGEADVGLIPVIEYQRIPDLLVLPDISIASKHKVKSVLFVSKKPLESLSRIAVDTSSRTSVTLLQIVLQKFYGIDSVSYHCEPPDPRRMLELYDAALIIGNAALEVTGSSFDVYDLAHEWNRFTGLPFVFAFWAVRGGVKLGEQARIFYLSREQGLREVDLIASLYSKKLGVPASEISSYIRENLDYSLDQSNLQGLNTFFDEAVDLEIIPSARPLCFYESETS